MPPKNLPSQDRPALRRAAWVLVIIMTLLLALAFVGVVWGFLRQGRLLLAAQPAAALPADTAPVTITLAPGMRIVSVTTEAGKLVMRVTGPAGDAVEIMDLATGIMTGEVRTQK